MSIDVTDPEFAAKLAAAAGSTAVRGPDGRFLGLFVPNADLEPSIEEMERLIDDPNTKWVTPEDVMARLREIDACGR